ncbi:MAG: phosphate ABC transporter permease subunit PstC [Phycisphaeraceae bacterium]|nr:phosphate ABC transporter permease subunit PstC [Phycisphaeraceae bacterium]
MTRQASASFAVDSGSLGKAKSKSVRHARDTTIIWSLIGCGIATLLITGTIIGVLATETITFFGMEEVSVVEFFTGTQWNPLLGAEKHYGIWPLICGTVLITVIAMAVALPLGTVTAIWLSEYAHPSLRAVIKPILEVLAGIPTVVFGFFALTVITPKLLQAMHEGFDTFNATSAGIAVGIMCLPIVCSLTEDALRAVPTNLREAAYGVGATRFEVALRVVVPAALSGIIAAFLLAIARAVGETMIVALAAGSVPKMSLDPTSQAQPMTGHMVEMFTGDASNYGTEYYSSYAVGATLFLMTLVLTVIGHLVRVRYRQVYE